MNSLTRKMMVAAFLILFGVGLSNCSKNNEAVVRLSSWGDVNENANLEDLLTEFRKIHPDIQVKLERIPDNSYVDKLLTQFAGGMAPDVIFVSNENVPDFYPRHLLEPLNSYIQADPTVKLSDFYPAEVKCFTVNGDTYGIPRDVGPVCVIYYNKKAFDDAGLAYPSDNWSVDDFLRDAIALTKRDAKGGTTQWGFADDWALSEAWIYAFGGRFVDDPQNPTKYMMDTPEFLNGVRFRGDLITKYKIMPSPANLSQQGGMGSSDLFANGTTAMFLSGIWKTPMFRTSIKNFKWDVAMFPKGPKGVRSLVGGGSGYGLLSTSKHKQEAWKLIAFLSSPEGQARFASTGQIQPARIAVANSPAFLDGKEPENKKMLFKAVDYGIDYPIVTNWREIQNGIIGPYLDRVWIGSDTAEVAVQKLNAELAKHPLASVDKQAK